MARRFLMIILCLFISSISFSANRSKEKITVQCGNMDFEYTASEGVKLSVFGIPALKDSAFWVAKPQWTGHHYGAIYNPEIIKEAKIEEYQGGKKITLFHHLPAPKQDYIQATETFILLPDNTYTASIDCLIPKSEPGVIEWTVGMLNALPYIGKEYLVIHGTHTTKNTIPIEAACKDAGGISTIEESTLGQDFDVMKFDSLLGPVEIICESPSEILLFDWRKAQWNGYNDPYFWLGRNEQELVPGKFYHYKVSIHFPDKPASSSAQELLLKESPSIKTISTAQIPHWNQDYIIPTPKSVTYYDSLLPLNAKTRIILPENPSPDLMKAAQYLQSEINRYYHLNIDIAYVNPGEKTTFKNVILLGDNNHNRLPEKYTTPFSLPVHLEGYQIKSGKNLVAVYAHNPKGVFYGITSLLQMIQLNQKGLFIKTADITDYPSLDFRGIHTFTGKNGKDALLKMEQDIWSRFKLNSWVWQVDYMIWDSHPEVAHPEYGMKKTDVKELVKGADDNFIEIIPCIQTLGHGEWMFVNGKNQDFTEDSTLEKQNIYCTQKPQAYHFIEDIFNEAIDLFHPKTIHINHDEISMPNNAPLCIHAPGKTETELINDNIWKLHDWLKERNIKTMLWSDVFLAKSEGPDACNAPSVEEAKKRRALLPKDVIVCDWHYVPVKPSAYASLTTWRDEGFETIGASWYMPNDIRNLAKGSIEYGVKGHLQCTWAGYNFQVDSTGYDWHQLWNFIYAAHYAWSGDDHPIRQLPFSVPQTFVDIWFDRQPVLQNRPGFQVDLTNLYNRTLNDTPQKTGWLGYGPDVDLSAFINNRDWLGETQFLVTPNKNKQSALLFAGKFNPAGNYPKSLEIGLKGKTTSELHFLMNSAFPTLRNKQVGEIQFRYQDGTKETMTLIYKRNLWAVDEVGGSPVARIAWKGSTRNGHPIVLRDVIWTNPHKEKPLDAVIINSFGTEASPVLFAITGVN